MDLVKVRTAFDALYFLLKELPDGFLSDSTKVVLRKIVSDLVTELLKFYDGKEL